MSDTTYLKHFAKLSAARMLDIIPEAWADKLMPQVVEALLSTRTDVLNRTGAAKLIRDKCEEWSLVSDATFSLETYDRLCRIRGFDASAVSDDADELLEIEIGTHRGSAELEQATEALQQWRNRKNDKPSPSQTIVESNQKLIDGTSPQAVREFLSPGDCRIESVKTEAGKPKLWKAKVAHADRLNKNRRIYPRAVWEANLTRLRPLLAEGCLGGAVDHASGWSGNLKDTCLIWRDLWMEADGGIFGKFEIIQTPLGQAFKAQIEAGLSVGFSTSGSGSAHEPSDDERKLYGLDEDTYAAVMNGDFTLQKIDSVDDPSVADARLAA